MIHHIFQGNTGTASFLVFVHELYFVTWAYYTDLIRFFLFTYFLSNLMPVKTQTLISIGATSTEFDSKCLQHYKNKFTLYQSFLHLLSICKAHQVLSYLPSNTKLIPVSCKQRNDTWSADLPSTLVLTQCNINNNVKDKQFILILSNMNLFMFIGWNFVLIKMFTPWKFRWFISLTKTSTNKKFHIYS